MRSNPETGDPSAFEVVSQLVAAMAAQDTETMKALHAEDYVLDWVYGDAFENPPISAEESAAFFPAWFIGFGEVDYEVKRTIAADEVVVLAVGREESEYGFRPQPVFIDDPVQ